MNRKKTGILAALALVLSAGLALADQSAVIDEVANGKAKVDWTKGKIYVVGRAVPKQGMRGAQARLTARLGARNDALTSWAAVVKEVRVSSESRNVDAALASDEVNIKIEAMIKAGLLIDKRRPETDALGFDDVGWNPEPGNPNDGEFVVVMVVPLNGPEGLTSHVVPQVCKPNFAPAHPAEPTVFQDVPPPDSRQIPTPAAGKITGLIVECTKAPKAVQPAMSPKVYVDGDPKKVVYGAGNLDTATAVQKGAVGYVTSLEAAKQAVERVGANPLVIAATETDGIASVGVSQADADKIAKADQADGFLKNCAVMFVIKD